MSNEETSGVNFPAINSQADEAEEAHGVGEAEQDILSMSIQNRVQVFEVSLPRAAGTNMIARSSC
jgi:hypothetical protein